MAKQVDYEVNEEQQKELTSSENEQQEANRNSPDPIIFIRFLFEESEVEYEEPFFFIRFLFESLEQEYEERAEIEAKQDVDTLEMLEQIEIEHEQMVKPEEDDSVFYIRYLFEDKKPAKTVTMVCGDDPDDYPDTSDYDETEEGTIRRNTEDKVLSWWLIFLRLTRKIAKCRNAALKNYLKRKLDILMQEPLQVQDQNRRNPHHVPIQVPIGGDPALIAKLKEMRERRLARRCELRAQYGNGALAEYVAFLGDHRSRNNPNRQSILRRILCYCDTFTAVLLILISLCVGYIIAEIFEFY